MALMERSSLMFAVTERERLVEAPAGYMVKQFRSCLSLKGQDVKTALTFVLRAPFRGIRVVPRENISRPL